MNDERDYFNLEQVAEICGQTIEEIKSAVRGRLSWNARYGCTTS
jgi:hypothetical protein